MSLESLFGGRMRGFKCVGCLLFGLVYMFSLFSISYDDHVSMYICTKHI